MIRKITTLCLSFALTGFVFASGTPADGPGKQKKQEIASTPDAASPGAVTAEMLEQPQTPAVQPTQSENPQTANIDYDGIHACGSGLEISKVPIDVSTLQKVSDDRTQKKSIKWKEIRKDLKKTPNKQGSGSSGIPIVAFILGILGFILGFTIILWPVALLFGLAAIVLGAIGLGSRYSSRWAAVLGLIFGILTILIPVLLVALILAVAL